MHILINGIIENLIAGFIATLCAAVLKKLWQFLKTGRSSHDSKTTKTYSAKLVKNQFFICLFAIPILMICALQLRRCVEETAASVLEAASDARLRTSLNRQCA